MLPTHGSVTSIYLLANAIRHGSQPDVSSWVRTAGGKSSFLAAAINHQPAAELLLGVGLVSLDNGIAPSAQLRAVSEEANRTTLVAIASMLLDIAPPPWLPLAVVDGQVHYEVIPSEAMKSMEWLQPELEQLLLNAAPHNLMLTNTLALGIGRAAELAIFAALTGDGKPAIHVSGISDRFGYDIESTDNDGVHRWEVKGCTERTAGTFHLSRNEFDKCKSYGIEWTVVQVEFSGAALVAEHITAAHIVGIQELSAAEVVALAAPDSDHFYWETSALITPPTHTWTPSRIEIPATLRLPGLHTLGQEVLDMRQRGTGGGE